jgi:hypothetical protein
MKGVGTAAHVNWGHCSQKDLDNHCELESVVMLVWSADTSELAPGNDVFSAKGCRNAASMG